MRRFAVLLLLASSLPARVLAVCPTTPATLVSPSNGATNISLTPTLSWSAVTNANQYDVHWAKTGQGACTGGGTIYTTSNTTFPMAQLQGGTAYEWQVVAKQTATTCTPTISSCFTFTTVSCNPPGPFTLTAPGNGETVGPTPTLSWTVASNAAKYVVHIGTSNPPTPTANDPVVSGTSFKSSSTLPDGTYFWYVDALANCSGGTSSKTSSAVSSFNVASCPTTAPTLIAPAAGAQVPAGGVTFQWSAVTGAGAYEVDLSADAGATFTAIGTTTATSLTKTLPAGSYVWSVRALSGPNCPAMAATASTFTVVAVCPADPGAPSLIAPAAGASVPSPVALAWSAVSGASSYRVWASLAGGTRVVLGTTTATTLTATLPQGSVTWLVEARFDNCPSTFSPTSTFTVTTSTTCNNAAPALLSPANGASDVVSPVELKWAAVTGATSYTLFIGADSAGTTTETELTRLVPAGTVTWHVVASFAGCPDVASQTFTFTVKSAQACGGTVTLVSPAAGATVPAPVTLLWNGVSGAASYRVWASFNDSAPAVIARTTGGTVVEGMPLPAGKIEWFVEALFASCPSVFSSRSTFTVQASATCGGNAAATLESPHNGDSVSSPVDFEWHAGGSRPALHRLWLSVDGAPFSDAGTTRETKLERDVAPGKVVWYVESLFEGCPTALQSAKGSFTVEGTETCNADAPSTLAPADGATNVSSPVRLTWTAVAGAEEYRVYASLDGGDAKLIAQTDDTAVTKILPPGVVRWLVEAVREECPTTRSAAARFTIATSASCAKSAPELVAPADGSTVANAQVRLDWNPVSGAIGYAVYAEHDDGAKTRIGETAESELEQRLPPGTIEWWVVAFFNGCPPLESKHLTFTITAPENCNRTVKPLLLSPPQAPAPIASPVHLAWSFVPGATRYKVWASIGGAGASVIGTTDARTLKADLPAGVVAWFVEADFAACPAVFSSPSFFVVRAAAPPCATPARPAAEAPAQVASGSDYTVRWTPVDHAASFELQESSTADFAQATTSVVTTQEASFSHVVTAPRRWFYRVRAVSDCNDQKSADSRIVSVVVIPPANAQRHTSVEVGTRAGITQQITIPGRTPPVTFTARGDKPWITVAPSSGTLGPGGVVLTVTFDPAALALGTNTGTVLLTYGSAGKSAPNAGTSPSGVPVSVSLVTPVQPGGKSGPLPESLIIPAVGHAAGANNSLFESDVRIANASAQLMKYQLNFTLSGTNGTQSGQSTTIQIDPGGTMALDDILASFFGLGAEGDGATGTLEIRPLTAATSSLGTTAKTSVQTVASSRTYNTTPTGTFGQFIPAIPFSQFLGNGGGRISLQQVAQSAAYRTNFGLVEASGQKADVLVHVFDNAGSEVAAPIAVSLQAGEHKQINNFLAANGIALSDGRLEIEVTSATGKVTAYASTVDNFTNDPLLVLPVLKGALTSTRFVLPGIADINNGFASWRSDIRIFNAGAAPVTATLAYVPQPGNTGTPNTVTYTLQPGEVKALDNAMQSVFGLTNSGGAVIMTTEQPSALVATARTYNQTDSGTYGQFIPGVTPAESVGLGDRTLQVLQLESSTRMRTNIGVTETSGQEVTVLVTAIPPDGKLVASTTMTLAPNEFRQFSLDSFGLGTMYNARVTLKVTGGSGRVAGYGSVIDQLTQDPTYVMAQ